MSGPRISLLVPSTQTLSNWLSADFIRQPPGEISLSALRWGLVAFGVILLLAGVVFSLQGANIIGGSALMSGNSTYIYVGIVVALIGLVLLGIGLRPRKSGASA